MNPITGILGIIAIVTATVVAIFALDHFFPWPIKKAAAKPAIIEHCHGKVIYLQFESAVVTKLKPDGKIWTCGGV